MKFAQTSTAVYFTLLPPTEVIESVGSGFKDTSGDVEGVVGTTLGVSCGVGGVGWTGWGAACVAILVDDGQSYSPQTK